MASHTPLLKDGDDRFGKQDPGPWLDVRAAFAAPGANPLRTFREWVDQDRTVPPGWRMVLHVEQPEQPADVDVILLGHRTPSGGVPGALVNADLAVLMKGSKLRWRFELEPAH